MRNEVDRRGAAGSDGPTVKVAGSDRAAPAARRDRPSLPDGRMLPVARLPAVDLSVLAQSVPRQQALQQQVLAGEVSADEREVPGRVEQQAAECGLDRRARSPGANARRDARRARPAAQRIRCARQLARMARRQASVVRPHQPWQAPRARGQPVWALALALPARGRSSARESLRAGWHERGPRARPSGVRGQPERLRSRRSGSLRQCRVRCRGPVPLCSSGRARVRARRRGSSSATLFKSLPGAVARTNGNRT